jgi:chromosome partitioning protein
MGIWYLHPYTSTHTLASHGSWGMGGSKGMSAFKILLNSPKGGPGKSTLCGSLAVAASKAGFRVAVVDADPQGSFSNFYDKRVGLAYDLLESQDRPTDEVSVLSEVGFRKVTAPLTTFDGDLNVLLADLAAELDVILIDTPPGVESHTDAIKRMVLDADYVLVPTQVTTTDLDSVIPWMTALLDLGVKTSFILNRIHRNRNSTREAVNRLTPVGPICPVQIADIDTVHESYGLGLSILEIKPSTDSVKNCIGDMKAFWEFVAREVGLIKFTPAAAPKCSTKKRKVA